MKKCAKLLRYCSRPTRWLTVLGVLSCLPVSAMMVDWSGTYRFEYTEVDRPSLDSNNKMRKSYLLNSLQLGTEIIASDGVNIVTKFDVLNNPNYPDDQTGTSWGTGPSKPATGSSSGQDSSVNSSRQSSSAIKASQLYVKFKQDNGLIVVGRAPVFSVWASLTTAAKAPLMIGTI